MAKTVHLDTIGQIALTVSDLAAAKQFYGDVLGMSFLFDAGTMAFYQCGTIRLMLGLAETPAPIGGTIVYFKVDDIEGTHAALMERSVKFVHAPRLVAKMPDHDLWMGFLKDPSGNTLGLMSEVAPSR